VQENSAVDADAEGRFPISNGADPLQTISLLWQGYGDPQMRFENGGVVRATRTVDGPATVRIRVAASGAEVVATAWGVGAKAALELVPGLVGALDDASTLVPRHDLVAGLVRRLPGLRLTRGGSVMEALVPSILGQKVTGPEARGAHHALLRRYGDPAPGLFGLRLPPPPAKLAALPYWAYHEFGIERRRADTIRAAAAVAPQLEAVAKRPAAERGAMLMSLPGIGPWTAAETLRLALGDPDAVSVGDYHLPRLICSALAGERDGDDARMLELLEPYRGQRARVALLIERSGVRQQRFAPRMRARSIAAY
jgi:3-methyladenine DNA glycosylase/8-oxoguanine DNA glycosylase